MKLITHLSFNGQCEAAFKLYSACLGGEVAVLLRNREASLPYSPEMADKIFHATLKIGDQVLTGVDIPGDRYEKPRGFSVQLNITDLAKAHAIFEALGEGGLIHFPMQRTAWADAYAALTDVFGTPWEINCGQFT